MEDIAECLVSVFPGKFLWFVFQLCCLSFRFFHPCCIFRSLQNCHPFTHGFFFWPSDLLALLYILRGIFGPRANHPTSQILKIHTDLSFTCKTHRVYLRFENEATVHNCLGALCYPNGSWFYSVLCKLGHRCFIAAKCFETISYVQWEKKPLKIHAEIIKLFNFTVKLSEQVMNLSLYCLPLHTWIPSLCATENSFPVLLSTPHSLANLRQTYSAH